MSLPRIGLREIVKSRNGVFNHRELTTKFISSFIAKGGIYFGPKGGELTWSLTFDTNFLF